MQFVHYGGTETMALFFTLVFLIGGLFADTMILFIPSALILHFVLNQRLLLTVLSIVLSRWNLRKMRDLRPTNGATRSGSIPPIL
jgi:hypothetical protein